jgi:hypothetical protein
MLPPLVLVAALMQPALAAEQVLVLQTSPGSADTFQLPVANAPLRIEISTSLRNGGHPSTGGDDVSALLALNNVTQTISWICFDVHGHRSASNTSLGPVVATYYDGPTESSSSSFEIADAVHGVAEVYQTPSSSISFYWTIHMWW